MEGRTLNRRTCGKYTVLFSKIWLGSRVVNISYLKAHAAEVIRKLGESGEPLVITQNGEAKAVIQDIKSYEQIQETMVLLKILALGTRQIEEGKVQSADDVVRRLLDRQETH
jgi:prevent-host-death family protein